jgi:hypothetical protein
VSSFAEVAGGAAGLCGAQPASNAAQAKAIRRFMVVSLGDFFRVVGMSNTLQTAAAPA